MRAIPGELARRYNVEGIDEVVILDVTATLEKRQALARTIDAVAREIFLPLTVGGGIRSEEDAVAAVDAGADKVSLNTAALRDPEIISTLARRYGSQAVIVAIDAKRRDDGFAVYVRSGTADAARDAVEWAREAEARGAGEILLTSMDRDGTKAGFDCEMTAAVSDAVQIPVIASGGAGTFEHFVDVFTRGHADAALAASIFPLRRVERGRSETLPARSRDTGTTMRRHDSSFEVLGSGFVFVRFEVQVRGSGFEVRGSRFCFNRLANPGPREARKVNLVA